MKFIKHHQGESLLNRELQVFALRGPGADGADTLYEIVGGQRTQVIPVRIQFQDGECRTADEIHGVTNESLLAVLIDRIEGLQRGPFAGERIGHVQQLLRAALWLMKQGGPATPGSEATDPRGGNSHRTRQTFFRAGRLSAARMRRREPDRPPSTAGPGPAGAGRRAAGTAPAR